MLQLSLTWIVFLIFGVILAALLTTILFGEEGVIGLGFISSQVEGVCGDGICGSGENCVNCADDCKKAWNLCCDFGKWEEEYKIECSLPTE